MGKAAIFVLVNCEIGKEKEILEELKNVPEVTEAYLLYGVYDLIIKIEGESNEKLKEVLLNKVRKIEGIKTTLSMVVVEGFERNI